MKFGDVVLRVQAPPDQSLASRPVASLAATTVTAWLMRRQANALGHRAGPEILDIPVLKGCWSLKAASSDAIRRAEEGPAGWWTVARTKRTAQ